MNKFAQLNQFKNRVMDSYRFIKRIYDGGIETPEQFTTFANVCQGHVDMCNILCYKLKPNFFGIFQPSKKSIFNKFKEVCAYTISEIQDMISTIQAEYDKLAEIDELRETMVIKAQIEYELANQFKEIDICHNKEIREARNIGFTYEPETDIDEIDEIDEINEINEIDDEILD